MSLGELARLVRGGRLVALTGAGISTESGIPDYRGVGRRPSATVQYQSFVRDPGTRRKYWARSLIGWPRIREAAPNAGHLALGELERIGMLSGIITQNVDGLHRTAGNQVVIELHGALERVRCLGCKAIEGREQLQKRLIELNPGWAWSSTRLAPDGDAELPLEAIESFRVADCLACAGILKPDVVFFGENVARSTVDAAHALLSDARALLVAGSSLAVFSGYRFVRAAFQRQIPIAIINSGPTRADALASIRLEARLGTALSELIGKIGPAGLTGRGIAEESKAL